MALIYFPRASAIILLVILLIVSSLLTDSKGQQITIEESPLPLLIPAGEIATFSCRVRCSHCRGFWIINGIPSEAGRSELERQGYTFTDSLSSGTNQQAMTATITASESVNDSSILCRYCPTADHAVTSCTNSMDVTLLVIASSPVTPNPTIQVNITHITLLWSPPFLWPNKRIHHYNVSFINKWQGKITSYWVNGGYSDRIASFMKRIDDDERSILVACSEMIVLSIFAVGVNASEELQTFNATASELIIPSNFTRSLSPLVRITNIGFYFTAEGKLSLTEAYLQLPICQINYTLSLLDENGSVLMEADRIKQRGLRVVNEFIKSNLQVNHSYSLKVITNIYSQNVQTSDQQFFNTSHLKDHSKPCNTTEKVMISTRQAKNIILYQIAVIILCLFITGVLLVSLICIILCVCWSCRRKTTAATGLKCNGQSHNKLGLTLSPAGIGVTYNCSPGDLSLSTKTQGNVSSKEEAYAVMNPAGSLIRSFTTSCDKEISKEFNYQEEMENAKI